MIKLRPKLITTLIGIAAIGALIAGSLMLFHNKQAAQPPTVAAIGAPSAHKPTQAEIDNYQVAAASPRYLYVPTIGVNRARIIHLGIDKNGQIAVPDNINDAGWYKSSAAPGQKGAMFIFGHVSSWEANGLFYDLHKLKPGDSVTVERGDGQKYIYKVVKTKVYPADKVDMNEVLAAIEANKPGLNLMTCTGTVKKGTSEFTERLVVFTSLN